MNRLVALIAMCGFSTASAGIPAFPEPLGLAIGMNKTEARKRLEARQAKIDTRADDKPLRGKSHKMRADFPPGGPVDEATLYFVKDRLWQVKLRPGERIRTSIEAGLGDPDARTEECGFWARPEKLQGLFCCPDKCQLFDMEEWVRAGESRTFAEEAYAGFRSELDRNRRP